MAGGSGSISISALAVGGTCFVFSATIHRAKGKLVKHLGMGLVVLTLVALSLAVDGNMPKVGAGGAGCGAPGGLPSFSRCRPRKIRLQFFALSALVCLTTGAWMLAGPSWPA